MVTCGACSHLRHVVHDGEDGEVEGFGDVGVTGVIVGDDDVVVSDGGDS